MKTTTIGQYSKFTYWKNQKVVLKNYSSKFTNYSRFPILSELIPQKTQQDNIRKKKQFFRALVVLQNMDLDSIMFSPIIHKQKPIIWERDTTQYQAINKKETTTRNITTGAILKILKTQGKISKNQYKKAIKYNLISESIKQQITQYYKLFKSRSNKNTIGAITKQQNPKDTINLKFDNLTYKVTIKKKIAKRIKHYTQDKIALGTLGRTKRNERLTEVYSQLKMEGVKRYMQFNRIMFTESTNNDQ